MKQKPRLYSEFADWWPLLSAPAEYEEEAEFFSKKLIESSENIPKTALELGSGGGNNASHMKPKFELTLVDLSNEMLRVSQKLNPECEHHQGDMRTVRLNKQFDCIFIHDAIDYMTSKSDLRQTIETAFVHCKPGGVALFAPDFVRENFHPSTEHGGHDGEFRSMRYMEWAWDPDPSDTTYIADFAYIFRSKDGSTQVAHDRHIVGLFSREDWIQIITEAGFEPTFLPFEHSDVDPKTHEIFIGKKPK